MVFRVPLERTQRDVLFSSFAAVSGTGLLSYAALPFLIGSTMGGLGLNEASVGLLYSLEFLAAALSSIIVAPRIGRIRRRNLAYVGAATVISGNLASALLGSYGLLLVIRPITGIGAGLALACGNATIANADQPDRIAAMMNVLCAGFLLLLMLILPVLGEHWDYRGVFFCLAVVPMVFMVLLKRMPQRARSIDSVDNPPGRHGTGAFNAAGVAIFIVFLMFTLRDSMAWGFVERIGIELGYTVAEVGGLLSLQALIGLMGPVIAALIGFKYGERLPLLFGVAFAGLTTWAIFYSVEHPHFFKAAVMAWTAGYFFTISYLTAYAATLDLDGRIVAASGSALVLGVGLGPGFSGFLISHGGYTMGAGATLGLVVAMMIATILSLKWAKESRGVSAMEAP